MNAVLDGGRRAILFFWFLLMQCITALAGDPQLSIVVDNQRNAPFEHGLVKLIAALKAKDISIEEVNELKAAHGTSIIVAGIGNSSTITSLQVSGKNHTVAQTAEALTIWEGRFKNKPVLVINGFDDRGVMYGLLDVAERISWANKNDPLAKVNEVS
jgi:hypothetical protein